MKISENQFGFMPR